MPRIRAVAMGDLHGYLPPVQHFENVDLVFIAGDVCPFYAGSLQTKISKQEKWVNSELRDWCRKVSEYADIISIPGNHDHIFQAKPKLPTTLKWHYLVDQSYFYKNIHIWGTPWVHRYTHHPLQWAFLADNAKEEKKKFAKIPSSTKILLCHETPRQGIYGSDVLSERIHAVKPNLVICGHVHDLRGVYYTKGIPVWNVGLTKGKSDKGYQLNSFSPFYFRINTD